MKRAALPPALAALAALAVLAGARPLAADPLPRGDAAEGRDAEPLAMSADQLDLDAEARTAVLTGHVKLTRGSVSVSCPRVDVRYDQVPHVTWVKATGGVVAEVKGVKAQAPEAQLDLAAQTLELQGGVRMTRGEGWLEAERATVHLGSGKVSLTAVKGSIPLPASAVLAGAPGAPGAGLVGAPAPR